MSTIVKETEVSSAVPEPLSAPAAASAAPSESAAKPQPVALEVSVTVNGARTLDGSDKREPFSESTKTVLVFGNGAVIRLQSSVAAGQLLFLTNEKTKKEVVCQVVKSKNYRNVSGYVELEFTEPVVGFWGMRFPNDRVPSAGVPSTSAPANVSAAPASGSPAAPVAAAPSSAPTKVPAAVPAPPAVAPVAASPVLHESKTPSAPPPAAAFPDAQAAKPNAAPSLPSTPATVTPIAPFISKSSSSTSSSASSSVLPSSSVLTLPRAAQPKSTAPTPIHLTPPPRELAPQPAAPAVPQEVVAHKTAAENSTDALRAENARLQEQLSALLFADGKKKDAAKTPASAIDTPASDLKPGEAAAKIFELAHASSPTPVAPKPVAVAPTAEKTSLPAPTSIAQPPAPQSPVAAKPAAPDRTSSLPLPSLREEEHVKIPSWLEPLARNAAVAAPTDEAVTPSAPASPSAGFVFDEPVPDAHWLNKDGLHKDLLPAERSQEDGADGLTQEDASQPDDAQESVDNIPTPDFGSRFLMEEKNASEDGAPKSNKLVFVGIAAAVIFAAVGGGYWYTHQGSPAASTTAAQNATAQHGSDSGVAAVAPQETPRPAAGTPGTARPGAIVNQIPTPAALNTNMVVTPSHASQPTTVAPSNANGVAQPLVTQPAAAQPKRPALGEVHLASPTVTRSNSSSPTDSEPSVALNGSAAPADTNIGENLASTSGPVAPSSPIPVGGDVKSAQLLKSVPPNYPAFARTQRISGDVKIDALIDATGKVTTMKVVSGPTLLHQAAMDALHQWKYQPATLDGKAVAMHLTVTIQFRMQ